MNGIAKVKTLLVSLLMSFVGFNAFGQPVAERILPKRGYFPNISFAVKLIVNSDEASQVTLIERPPAGWSICRFTMTTVGNVSADGVLTVNLGARSYTDYSITYFVIPPETANGDQTFSGTVNDRQIGGMTTVTQGTPEPVGIFQNHVDLGFVDYSEVDYDSQTGEYRITVGESAWESNEDGHFIYRKVDGDCSLEARVHVENSITDYYTVGELGIWNTLNRGNYVMVMIERKPNGVCYTAWGEGTETRFTEHDVAQCASANDSDGRLRIERNGDVISTYYFDPQIEE